MKNGNLSQGITVRLWPEKKKDRDRNRQNIKKRNIKERKALPFLVGEDDNERVFVRVLRVSFIGKFKR
jgi:hypothetical protein